MITLKSLLKEISRESLKTVRGSTIRRYRGNVGKRVGNQLYVHRKYASEVVPKDVLRAATLKLKEINPRFRFNSVMWDMSTNDIRFDEAPDFDTAREPHVGNFIVIAPDGTHREGSSNSIWHHKWLWVKDDYSGFDVDKAVEWSKLWISKVPEIAKGTDASFGAQLAKYGLKENMLNEARATPVQLVEFLRAMIKGTEWEGKVFAVGGFVRDQLLGKEPKDLDITVQKYQGGVEFTTWLGKKLGIYKEGSNPVIYPTYGTANLRLDGVVWNGIDFSEENVDAVMFRKEQYHDPDSRRPSAVQYTDDIRVDASRRDLTFNAIYMDIASGKIVDPTGTGVEDLKNGIVRTAIDPTEIYTDDALRMFRAIRFAAQLNFKLSPDIVDGIKKNLHRLGNTSKERVRDEINKILQSKHPRYGFELLRDTGLLPYFAQEFQQAVGMTQNVHHNEDVFNHILTVLQNTNPDLVTRLIALFHDIGKVVTRSETPTGVHFYGHEDEGAEVAEKIMRNLRYPTDLINAVKLGVKHHMKLKHGRDEAKFKDSTLRKFKIALGDQLEQVLDVIHADNIAHADASAMPNQVERVRQRLKALDVQVKKPALPINGEDLKAMGLKPGPLFSTILSAVAEAWYENPNITREEGLAIAQKIMHDQA